MANGIQEARKKAAEFKKGMADAEANIKELSKIVSEAMKDYGSWSADAADLLKSISQAKLYLDGTLSDLKGWVSEAKEIKGDAETILAKWVEDEQALTEMAENIQEAKDALAKDKTNKTLQQKVQLAEKAFKAAEIRRDKASADATRVFGLLHRFGPDIEQTKKDMVAYADRMKTGLVSLEKAKQDGKFSRDKK